MAELILPDSAREAKRLCMTCGTEFPHRQRSAWINHVIACEDKHPEVIGMLEEARTNDAFRSIQDVEQYRWLRQRAAQEGK